VACCYLDDHPMLLLLLEDEASNCSSPSSSLHPQNWLPRLKDPAVW
jgi:hypothetical protein